MKTKAQLAEEAADYLEEYGWMQNDYFNTSSIPSNVPWPGLDEVVTELHLPMCIAGVLYGVNAVDGEQNGDVLLSDIQGFLSAREGTLLNIVHWNDEPARAKEDVVSLLRDYAAEAS